MSNLAHKPWYENEPFWIYLDLKKYPRGEQILNANGHKLNEFLSVHLCNRPPMRQAEIARAVSAEFEWTFKTALCYVRHFLKNDEYTEDNCFRKVRGGYTWVQPGFVSKKELVS